MGAHSVHGFRPVTRGSIKKMFAGLRVPEGVAVKAMARLRTQFDVPTKLAVLNDTTLHKKLLSFSGIIVEGLERVIPQIGYCGFQKEDLRQDRGLRR
jgi:hypothetical protein